MKLRIVECVINNYESDKEKRDARFAKIEAALTKLNIPCDFPSADSERQYWSTSICVSVDAFLDLCNAGIAPTLKGEVSLYGAQEVGDMLLQFQLIADKAAAILGALSENSASFNQKCEVHMPGQALSSYNDTMLLEDGCTDQLQDFLDLGWRIIAACPQPDKRRPDYILGRWNPEPRLNGNAQRG